MSTFYLLPPRPLIAKRFGDFLATLFPGLAWDSATLAESLGSAAQANADVYVVYREDLPADEDAAHALVHAFGAQPGDEVVEVPSGINNAEISARRWRLPHTGERVLSTQY